MKHTTRNIFFFVGVLVYQNTCTMPKQIQLSVANQTDQDLVIEALYKVLPSKNPHLASMPNPFVFFDAPAHQITYAKINCRGGGRLGTIEHILVRTKNNPDPKKNKDFKKFDKKDLDKTNVEDVIMVTINTSMLP